MFNKLFSSCLENSLALYWLTCTYFSLFSYRSETYLLVSCACVCICVCTVWDPADNHRVFEILKILEFCGSRCLDTEESLILLCRGEAAGNCALSWLWRLQEAQIQRKPGFLTPLLTEFTSLKILTATWNVSSLKTPVPLLCSSWYMYRAKCCMCRDW